MKFTMSEDIFPEWMRGRIKKFHITASRLKSTIEIEFYPEKEERVKDER